MLPHLQFACFLHFKKKKRTRIADFAVSNMASDLRGFFLTQIQHFSRAQQIKRNFFNRKETIYGWTSSYDELEVTQNYSMLTVAKSGGVGGSFMQAPTGCRCAPLVICRFPVGFNVFHPKVFQYKSHLALFPAGTNHLPNVPSSTYLSKNLHLPILAYPKARNQN